MDIKNGCRMWRMGISIQDIDPRTPCLGGRYPQSGYLPTVYRMWRMGISFQDIDPRTPCFDPRPPRLRWCVDSFWPVTDFVGLDSRFNADQMRQYRERCV